MYIKNKKMKGVRKYKDEKLKPWHLLTAFYGALALFVIICRILS